MSITINLSRINENVELELSIARAKSAVAENAANVINQNLDLIAKTFEKCHCTLTDIENFYFLNTFDAKTLDEVLKLGIQSHGKFATDRKNAGLMAKKLNEAFKTPEFKALGLYFYFVDYQVEKLKFELQIKNV